LLGAKKGLDLKPKVPKPEEEDRDRRIHLEAKLKETNDLKSMAPRRAQALYRELVHLYGKDAKVEVARVVADAKQQIQTKD
jgi:hypothetical protein